MKIKISNEDLEGPMTLLKDCVGGQPGDRLLIVREPHGTGYYDEQAPSLTASAARKLGMTVYETVSDSFILDDSDKDRLVSTLSGFDHIVFFSRIGDQIRFSHELELPPSTMCYTLTERTLNSSFGTASHSGMTEIKRIIDNAMVNAKNVHVTCPLGTDYVGQPQWAETPERSASIKRFPLLVPSPVPSLGMTGKVALTQFLTGTGSQVYEPFSLELPLGVIAQVENNRIIDLIGDAVEIQRINKHYEAVSNQFSIEPWFVHSWHAGIHPGCRYDSDAKEDLLKWAGSAFGNPRILHFHTCGNYAPGEICWHVLDPTIEVDGIAIWESGRLHPERLVEGERVLDAHPELAALFAHPATSIGMD